MDDGTTVTTILYVTPELEIENPQAGAASGESLHWYLHPNIRREITRATTEIHAMHRNQLNSLVMMTDENADWCIERIYAPFGVGMSRSLTPTSPPSPS